LRFLRAEAGVEAEGRGRGIGRVGFTLRKAFHLFVRMKKPGRWDPAFDIS